MPKPLSQSVASILTLHRQANEQARLDRRDEASVGETLVRLARLASMRHTYVANANRMSPNLSETRDHAVSNQGPVTPSVTPSTQSPASRVGDGTDAVVSSISPWRAMRWNHTEVSR